jgi:hypothetical protein
LPGAVFSTSASALCVPPLRWGLLARLARRAVSEVLVRSSNWDLSGHCVSSVGRNVPRNLTRPACGFSSPPAARFQVRIYRRGATRAVGTGESCPEVPLARAAASGSRAHQLHPTFLRLPGVISELLARAVLKRRAFTRAASDSLPLFRFLGVSGSPLPVCRPPRGISKPFAALRWRVGLLRARGSTGASLRGP